MGSRDLYTGHHPARKQVSSGFVPSQQRYSVLMSVGLLFDASSAVHLRSSSHLTLDTLSGAFSSMLTTMALYHSSSTQFGIRSCNPIPRGQTLIFRGAPPFRCSWHTIVPAICLATHTLHKMTFRQLPETLIEALGRQADLQRTSRSAILEHYLVQGLNLEPAYLPHFTQGTRVDDGARKKPLKRR